MLASTCIALIWLYNFFLVEWFWLVQKRYTGVHAFCVNTRAGVYCRVKHGDTWTDERRTWCQPIFKEFETQIWTPQVIMHSRVEASNRQTQTLVSVIFPVFVVCGHYKHPRYLQCCLKVLGHFALLPKYGLAVHFPLPFPAPTQCWCWFIQSRPTIPIRGFGKLINDFHFKIIPLAPKQ